MSNADCHVGLAVSLHCVKCVLLFPFAALNPNATLPAAEISAIPVMRTETGITYAVRNACAQFTEVPDSFLRLFVLHSLCSRQISMYLSNVDPEWAQDVGITAQISNWHAYYPNAKWVHTGSPGTLVGVAEFTSVTRLCVNRFLPAWASSKPLTFLSSVLFQLS